MCAVCEIPLDETPRYRTPTFEVSNLPKKPLFRLPCNHIIHTSCCEKLMSDSLLSKGNAPWMKFCPECLNSKQSKNKKSSKKKKG